MENILTATTVIGAIVLGGTQMIKQTSINNKWLPILNVLLGVIIGIGWALSFATSEVLVYAWAGGLAGMSAGGFYDLGTNVKGIANENQAQSLIEEGKGMQDTREDGE